MPRKVHFVAEGTKMWRGTILLWLSLLCFQQIVGCSGTDAEDVKISPPVIDFSKLSYNLENVPEKLFEQIEDALINHGAFIAVNHSVWLADQASAFRAANDLFGLSPDEKEAMLFNETQHFGRGYLSFGAESGLSANFEPKEGFSYGHPQHTTESFTPGSPWLRSPNTWPESWNTEQVQPFNTLYHKFSSLAEMFLTYVVYGRLKYRQKRTSLMIAGGSEISVMRLFHYFPLSSPIVQEALASEDLSSMARDRILGSSAHTDWGLLTIIMQNGVTGLQYRKNNQWVDVPYIPQSLVFNCGDYFSLVTDREYHSPVHRVLSPETQERFSFVYFFYPHYDSPLTTVPAEKKSATADVDAGASVDVDGEVEHNTLLKVLHYEDIAVLNYDKEHTEAFGDYILKKWRGVYRG